MQQQQPGHPRVPRRQSLQWGERVSALALAPFVHENLPFMHAEVSPAEAEHLLQAYGMADGLFLVHPSTSGQHELVLSLAFDRHIFHHPIAAQVNNLVFMRRNFRTVAELIEYARDYHPEEGWVTPVSIPIECPDRENIGPTPFPSESAAAAAAAAASMTPAAMPQPSAATAQPQSLARADFDLSTVEMAPYEGDQLFDAHLHMTPEVSQLGLDPSSPEKYECLLKTTEGSVQLLTKPQKGQGSSLLAEFPLGGIEQLDTTEQVVRLMMSETLPGVWYLDCDQAEEVQSIIEGNQRRIHDYEDHRIAQLLQNEEFINQMQRDPELAGAFGDDASPTEMEHRMRNMGRGKTRSKLGKLARKFTLKKSKKRAPATEPVGFFNIAHEEGAPPPAAAAASPAQGDFYDVAPPEIIARTSLAPAGDFNESLYSQAADVDPSPVVGYALASDVSPESTSEVTSFEARAIANRHGSLYDPEALSYSIGDTILVTRKDSSGRWHGICNGKTGHFPFTEVEVIEEEPEPDHTSHTFSDDREEPPPPFDAPAAWSSSNPDEFANTPTEEALRAVQQNLAGFTVQEQPTSVRRTSNTLVQNAWEEEEDMHSH
eukprot:m.66348 g.66348  ORF g.66348 m.66348 type:complete len:601 (-) comp7619_c0_seq1:2868-4670(-)